MVCVTALLLNDHLCIIDWINNHINSLGLSSANNKVSINFAFLCCYFSWHEHSLGLHIWEVLCSRAGFGVSRFPNCNKNEENLKNQHNFKWNVSLFTSLGIPEYLERPLYYGKFQLYTVVGRTGPCINSPVLTKTNSWTIL